MYWYEPNVMTNMSILDYINFGSSMSLRSFSKLGNMFSALDFAVFGSTSYRKSRQASSSAKL